MMTQHIIFRSEIVDTWTDQGRIKAIPAYSTNATGGKREWELGMNNAQI
jgi:hypothetical protein